MTDGSKSEASLEKLAEAQELFILEWGRMSAAWGINRTMAQIHALLYITGEYLTMDEIAERLRISRGNASMNLRELVAWGMVHRYRRPGDRRDVYFSETDVWHMFTRVVRERKRREVDPTVAALRDCLALIREEPEELATETYRTRVKNLLDVFALLDELYRTVVTDDDALKRAVEQGAALHGVATPPYEDR